VTGAADNGRPLLAARGVTRRFGASVALEATSLDVEAGETLALVGPNGAGKSTLLALLARALEPSAGVVEEGREALRVGWVPQRPAHYGRLSARENLALFARLERLPRAAERARVASLLELVEIDAPDRPAVELSVGNQQRLNIAIALLSDPDVLLLDEPTASLDPRQRRRVWELASGVRGRGGAVVFATQNVDELERFADAVAVLEAGRLVFHGPLDEYERARAARAFA
jgi:ABC-2 type transport system ATP-binding protein